MLEIVYKKTADLIPYVNNSRTHSAEQVQQVASSIQEFGFTNPILIDNESGIIAGHGRLQAAQKLGLDEIPTITLFGLSEAQKKAYVIADNQLALNAGWDLQTLKNEVDRLTELDFDIDLLGFDDDFLATLTEEQMDVGLTDEDDIPEAPDDPVAVEGDVWILGSHRLMCGDSTSIDQVEKLMNGVKADMIFTDPPYNVDYQGGTGMKIQNDNMEDSQFRAFLYDAFTTAYTVTKAGRPIYVAHADSEGYNFRGAMKDSGWLLKQCIVWVKNSMVMGRQDYQWQHEPILYGWKDGAAHKWYGNFDKKTVIDDDVDVKKLDKKQLVQMINSMRNKNKTTVVREDKPHKNDIHPTMKPVNLVQQFINNSSREEDVILDLFGGGGSTLIAAQKLNRTAHLMELDPKYIDVIIRRWQDYTGLEAKLEETGESYNDKYMNGQQAE